MSYYDNDIYHYYNVNVYNNNNKCKRLQDIVSYN